MIVAVGHADLTPASRTAVEHALRQRLERLEEPSPGLVRAGAGLSVEFGRAVRAAGRRLVVMLPAQGAVPASLPPYDLEPARTVLALAGEARLFAYDPLDRHARIRADEAAVALADRVFAVWDGSPTDGSDATAHLVAYARARSVPVEVVWPAGAVREWRGPDVPAPGSPGDGRARRGRHVPAARQSRS